LRLVGTVVTVVAEVDVEVFGLGGDVVGERVLETGAERPADVRLRLREGETSRGVDARELRLAVGQTTRHVDEGAVEGGADAGADGTEVLDLAAAGADVAVGERRGSGLALEVGVLDVRLETDDELADLVVVADLATADEAVRIIEARSLRELTPAVAGVHTDVETGPGEDRNDRSRSDGGDVAARKVGSERRGAGSDEAGSSNTREKNL